MINNRQKWWRAAALLLAVVFTFFFLQERAGLFLWKSISLKIDEQLRKEELGYSVRLPEKYANAVVARRAVVRENGEPLPLRVDGWKHVRTLGAGRYVIQSDRRYIRFAPTDNSDPRENGRRYDLYFPERVQPVVFWGGAALLLLVTGLALRKEPERKPDGKNAFWGNVWFGAVLLGALGLGVFALLTPERAPMSDFQVNGMPYSDALGWNELAISLKEGQGFQGNFEGHRPFYAIFLGSVYAFFGNGLLAARLVNLVAALVATGCIFTLCRRAFSVPVALLAVGFFFATGLDHPLIQFTVTEPLAFAFHCAGLLMLWIACVKKQGYLFLITGLLLGFSNLTRPATLLAFPLFGLVIFFVWLGSKRSGLEFFKWGTCMLGGVLIVFLPWMLRQKMVNDTVTISLNSSDLLYAATMEEGKWNGTQYKEAREAGIPDTPKDLHAYFSERFGEVLETNPQPYFLHVKNCFIDYFDAFHPNAIWQRTLLGCLLLIVALATTWRSRQIWPLITFFLLLIFFEYGVNQLPFLISFVFMVMASFFFWGKASRIAIALLFVAVLGAAILSAMVGNFSISRAMIFSEWIIMALVGAFSFGAIRFAGRMHREEEPAGELFPRWGMAMVFGLFAFIALGLVLISVNSLKDSLPPMVLTEDVRQASKVWVKETFPSVEEELLYVEPVSLGEYRSVLAANEDVEHFSRAFEQRPYERTMAFLRVGVEPNRPNHHVATQILGNLEGLPKDKAFVLVGVQNIDDDAPLGMEVKMVEALALVPLGEAGADFQNARVFEPTPEAMEISD